MYHPSRGGVRGGRDQFNWDDVKGDKYRENYIGHSLKAPVGRWQKGKDLHWYVKDKKSHQLNIDAAKAEIQKIKEEEEQAMREVLGLAPKRQKQTQGSRLDKREAAELFKRGKISEDLAPGYAEGERVQGLGYAPAPHHLSCKRASLLESGQPASGDEHLLGSNVDGERDECSPKESKPRSVAAADSDVKRRERKERKVVKEQRREEKRAAKKAKREHRRNDQDDSDLDRPSGRKRVRRRHDSSDSSEEDR